MPEQPFTALRGRSRFKRVFREGKRTKVGAITVIAAPGVDAPAAVGIVIGRRFGTAVARNRARRRIREALRAAGPPAGYDMVVVAERGVEAAPFDQLVGWIRRAVEEESE